MVNGEAEKVNDMTMRGKGRVGNCRGGFEEGKRDISLVRGQLERRWGEIGGTGKEGERGVGFAL